MRKPFTDAPIVAYPSFGEIFSGAQLYVETGLAPLSCITERFQNEAGPQADKQGLVQDDKGKDDHKSSSYLLNPDDDEPDQNAYLPKSNAATGAQRTQSEKEFPAADTDGNATRAAETILGPVPVGNHSSEIDVDAMVQNASAKMGNPLDNNTTANPDLIRSSSEAISEGSSSYTRAAERATTQAYGTFVNNAASSSQITRAGQEQLKPPSATPAATPPAQTPQPKPYYISPAPPPKPVPSQTTGTCAPINPNANFVSAC